MTRRRKNTQPLPIPARLPEGSGLIPRHTYSVRIRYREPGYEARRGSGPRLYRWTFKVQATDAQTATSAATRAFRDVERDSSVGWSRDIVDIEVLDETLAT